MQQFERSLSQTHLLNLSSPSRGRGQLELTMGTETLVAAVLGSLFYPVDAGVVKYHSVHQKTNG